MMVDVSLDLVSGPNQPALVLVMLQGPDWVLSLRATPREWLPAPRAGSDTCGLDGVALRFGPGLRSTQE